MTDRRQALPGASDPPRIRSAARQVATLGVAPELSDPIDPIEVGEHQDVEEFGAGSRTEGVQAFAEAAFKFFGSHGPSLARFLDIETKDPCGLLPYPPLYEAGLLEPWDRPT
jgi:hypothetical protein